MNRGMQGATWKRDISVVKRYDRRVAYLAMGFLRSSMHDGGREEEGLEGGKGGTMECGHDIRGGDR